jgi:hypothetical protein
MLRRCSWNIRNGNPEGKKVVFRVTALGRYRTSVMMPASIARSRMDFNMGAASTREKILIAYCSLSAGFFSKPKTAREMKCELPVKHRQALIPFYLS